MRAALRGLPLDEQTLPRLLERQARACGGRTLVRFAGEARSYDEMRDAAARTAGALRAAGLAPGDRVAAVSENRLELLELWLGCAWLGAIFVPVNPALRGEGLEHVLRDADPRLLLAEDQLASLPPGELVPPHPAEPGDTAGILYTSGTTGPAKGVLCPHAQWYWWGILTGELLEIGEDDVLYTTLPLFHTNALNAFCQALVAGATYVLGPRFSASRFWQRTREADATVTYLLGAMVTFLWRQLPAPADRDHRVRVALAPAAPPDLVEPFRERFGVRLLNGWGSTETNLVIASPAGEQRPGVLGKVLDDFDARVGAEGELLVRARHPFAFATGYHNLPDETARAWRDGWFHSGDRVALEPDGSFRFVDRIKESIRRRGENISSWEVERALEAHPDVSAAAVVPAPSEYGEDEVLAFVVARDADSLEPAELVRFLDGRLAAFAIPRYVEIVRELPLTPNGKVAKAALRERGISDTTWDRERASRVP